MSKSYDNARDLDYITYIPANNSLNFSATVIGNGSSIVDATAGIYANAAFLQANSAYNAVNTLSQNSITNGTSNVSVALNGNVTVSIAGYTTEVISANLINRTEGVLDNTLFRVNSKNVTSNITISNTYNYMSVGPITIANGITVTIANDAYWTIV
jgi:hypothetical protein